ncbi:MAG: tRNA pseudouridine(55) synthase TruB [Mariprofundales bacterium]|nr:tRNA pseudouridine(55) synthase TruB [Mariprofundales bacterium]
MTMASGVVFLDKPVGMSSRQAVNAVARIFAGDGRKLKAGHTGTLDPLASGMLPILLGQATRFASMGLEADKVYRIEIDLSYQTDTLDEEGAVQARFEGWNQLSVTQISDKVSSFIGDIDQVPPAFSAIRIGGERSYKLARSGAAVEIPSRRVTIHSIDLLNLAMPKLELRVHCSKGTYMRALARDLGEALGCGGCITALRRLQTGGWESSWLVTMEQLAQNAMAHLHPISFWLRHLPQVVVDSTQAARLCHGQRVALKSAALVDPVMMMCGGLCFGVGKVEAGNSSWPVLHPLRVIPGVIPLG